MPRIANQNKVKTNGEQISMRYNLGLLFEKMLKIL